MAQKNNLKSLVLAVTDEGFLLENVAVDPSHHGRVEGDAL